MPLESTARARGPVAALVLFGIIVGAGAVGAQVTVTVVMKSGERHTGENPQLSESGEFGLRREARGELRAKASDIAYVEFAALPHRPPEFEATQQAVVLRTGKIVTGRLVDMGHLMHDDETSEYVVRFRDADGEALRLLDTDIARIYFSPPTPSSAVPGR